jgi:hypothetical protein
MLQTASKDTRHERLPFIVKYGEKRDEFMRRFELVKCNGEVKLLDNQKSAQKSAKVYTTYSNAASTVNSTGEVVLQHPSPLTHPMVWSSFSKAPASRSEIPSGTAAQESEKEQVESEV